MAEHRNDIILREQGEPSDDWFDEPKKLLSEIFSESGTFVKNYLKGKGEAEVAKVSEIKARVLEKLANLAMENKRIIAEQNMKRAEARDRHEEKVYELETDRMKVQAESLKAIAEALKTLKESEVEVDIKQIVGTLIAPRQGGSAQIEDE